MALISIAHWSYASWNINREREGERGRLIWLEKIDVGPMTGVQERSVVWGKKCWETRAMHSRAQISLAHVSDHAMDLVD